MKGVVDMKILIVEDNEDSRNLLVKQLRAYGHEVTAAADGVEALEQALAQPPDVIVSDILMPKMDGYQLCQECKQNDKLKDIPFIFYTATYTKEEDEKFALSLGGAAFVVKPTEPDVLVQMLSEIVEKAKSGALAPSAVAPLEPSLFLTEYTKRIVAKLENKVTQLEVEITQRKRAEEELRESERRYRLLAENAEDVIWTVDMNMRPTYMSPSITRLLGYSVEEAMALPMEAVYAPASFETAMKVLAEELAIENMEQKDLFRSRTLELELNRKDGSIVPVEVKFSFIRESDGRPVKILAIARDITERKRVEEALRKSEDSLAEAQRIAHIGSWELDIVSNTLTWSDEVYRMFGLEPQQFEATYEAFLDNIHPDDREMVNKAYTESVTNKTPYSIVHRLLLKDGTVKYVNERCETFYDDGKPIRSIGTVQDITERRQAEERMKQTAEEWKTTFDSITDLVSICDKDFRLIRVNKAFADVVKMKPEELIGKPCYEIVHGTNEPLPNCPHKVTMETRKSSTVEFFEPHLGIHLEVATSPIFNENGEVVASVHLIRDITERKRMEGQLIITDRLASIGELSSGIAHELNNPLTSVIGFSELLLDRDVPDDVKEDLEVINREAKRTAGVVRNLLTFARKHEAEKKPVDIHKIIQRVLELRAYEQKVSNIEVNTRFAPDLPEITADDFQLQQVFINIIINAEHFMIEAHRRGTLTITTERLGDIIRASFADDGPGITKENLGHLFDPFFTTKEVGKGTGLGLSICHGIVTEHGGRIYAESKLGKGATFVVELPINKQ